MGGMFPQQSISTATFSFNLIATSSYFERLFTFSGDQGCGLMHWLHILNSDVLLGVQYCSHLQVLMIDHEPSNPFSATPILKL